MTIIQLEYILAVEKHRHFGKAAKACSVTQPTLSMQLQKVEEELGVIFFDRS
jgi:LysR family hydrogen peroxide-inducible transcriptional activator